MKKLILLLLISVAGVSCKKEDLDAKHCWSCDFESYANGPNNPPYKETFEECDKSTVEIRALEKKIMEADHTSTMACNKK